MRSEVAMLHSVGSNHTKWCDLWLTVDAEQFERMCAYLERHQYHTDFLDHWYYLEDHPEEKTGKEFYLTFDDGYLDNLLVAYPILAKHHLKATIFVNPEFVDTSSGIRTLKESAGGTLGFLNWDEIKFLQQSGVFDIQSHSMSHNFYFASDKLVDIYEGQDTYHWMPWIAQPDKKMYWQYADQTSFVPFGTPVFEKGRALGLRRYFPDSKLDELGQQLLQQGLPKEDIIKQLREVQKEYPGRFETDEEMSERYRYELEESKRILEVQLNKPVDFLCWPGGGYNELSLRMAEEAGYKASTIASRDRKAWFDNKGMSYKRIKRNGLSSVINLKGKYIWPINKNLLTWRFLATFRGSFLHTNLLRAMQVYYSL